MIIISGGRGIGKTKMLLEQAADAGGVVVCSDPASMRDRAHKYGITGLEIISYQDLYAGEKPVYVHDVGKFLCDRFGTVHGYSQCND